jgi:hypothetical protein
LIANQCDPKIGILFKFCVDTKLTTGWMYGGAQSSGLFWLFRNGSFFFFEMLILNFFCVFSLNKKMKER